MIYSADEKSKQHLKDRYSVSFDLDIIDHILKNNITVIIRENQDIVVPPDALLIGADYIVNRDIFYLIYDSKKLPPKEELEPETYKFDRCHSIVHIGYPPFNILPEDKIAKVMELHKQINEIVGDADGRKDTED